MTLGVGVGRTILDKVVREDLFNELRLEESVMGISRGIPGNGKSKYKDSEMRWAFNV